MSSLATRSGLLLLATSVLGCEVRGATFELRSNDVVAFVGGATLVAAERSGALETLLTLAHPGMSVRFRSLAWEGDTALRHPREVNFPEPLDQLDRIGATVVFVQFGAMEALGGEGGWSAFREAYGRLLDRVRERVPRTVAVTPVPFEPKPPPLPDLTRHNDALAGYAATARDLAIERGLAVVDLFEAFRRHPPEGSWTTDGRELSEAGHEALAVAWLRELGHGAWAMRAAEASFWRRDEIRELREAIVTKNRLWFESWRPTNWAFLGGDRSDQPSSRDHRDTSVRWFPEEMARYGPLIAEAERRVVSLGAQIGEERR